MIRKGDVRWWVLEANRDPESAPQIIEELAKRLVELDAENERLRDQILRLQQPVPESSDDAELATLRGRVAALQDLLESGSTEPSLVVISHSLQAVRLPLSRVEQRAHENRPVLERQAMPGLCSLLLARPHEQLLFLTSHGRGRTVLAAGIPLLADRSDWPDVFGGGLAEGERLTAAATTGRPPRFWSIATQRGHVRQIIRIELEMEIAREGVLIQSPFQSDRPAVAVDGDGDDLLVVTQWGKWVRFPQRAIPTEGAAALALDPDDRVVGAVSLSGDAEIVAVTAAGYAMRREAAKLEGRSQPGGSPSPLIQAFDVLGVFPYRPRSRLLMVTYSGRLLLTALDDVPLHHRADKGTRLCDLSNDPAVAATIIPGHP